jgi:uncharacterized protein (DUF302 family)
MKEIVIAGLTTIASSFGPAQTIDRLESAIREKGLTIFARIDHAAGAAEVGSTLRPTTLIIFGNARGGTPLMQSAQTAGIDLPLKLLVWEDAAGKTWVSYEEPSWVAQRHRATGVDEVVARLSAALKAISSKATSDPTYEALVG